MQNTKQVAFAGMSRMWEELNGSTIPKTLFYYFYLYFSENV